MGETINDAEFREYVKRMETEHKHLHKRLDDMLPNIRAIQDMTVSVEKLATNMEHMIEELQRQRETQEKHDVRIENLEARDGEMWRKVVGYAITALVGAFLGYAFKQIGL